MPGPAFKRVEELFHQALTLGEDERPTFLDTACAGDGELRAAVEALLKHDREPDAASALLASPLARQAGAYRPELATLLEPSPPAIAVGGASFPAIPGYEILEELGRGGMGVVYKARQVSLNRIVALKMLLPAYPADPKILARFRVEAEALARLQHPNVVPIYDIGACDGQPYFTMEYVAGPNLAQQANGKAQDVAASARLIETLARAVHALHERGIIHRDLKPANVLLTPAAVPKITDFGLARDETAEGRLTRSGTTMGTPCYMAPEQARGKIAEVGPAADIYSLGAILYEMLIGRPPFEAETPAETIVQVLNDEPLAPSRLRPRLPRDLVTICLKSLEKSPRRRYASAWDLADDLARFQAGKPIQARPVGPIERTYRWCRRKPLVAALLALSSILVVAIVVTVVVYEIRLQDALLREEQQEIVQLNTALGLAQLEKGDAFAALLRFTEALRLDEGAAERERDHRIRIATALRQCPHLADLLILDKPVLCASVGKSGAYLATVEDHRVGVFALPKGESTVSEVHLQEPPIRGCFSPDGRFLAMIGNKSLAQVWNLSTGDLSVLSLGSDRAVQRLVFHPNSRILIIQQGSAIVSWDVTTGNPVPIRGFPRREATFAALSDNGQWLFTIDAGHEGQVWDVETGKAEGLALAVAQTPSLGVVSPDGRRVGLVDRDNVLRIWDMPAGKRIGRAVQMPPEVSRLVFSPDAERVFTARRPHGAQVWKVQTGEMLVALPWSESAVQDARFSADGRLLLTVDVEGTARVWDTAAGRALTPPLRHGGSLAWAGWGAGDKEVVTVGRSGTVCFWELPQVSDNAEPILDMRPVAGLLALAQVQAFAQIDEKQEQQELTGERVRALWEGLHAAPSR